jgi:hypothetical protein
MSKDHVDPGVDLHIIQLLGEGMVRTTWPRIDPHGNRPHMEWLNPVAKKACRMFMPVSPSHRNY